MKDERSRTQALRHQVGPGRGDSRGKGDDNGMIFLPGKLAMVVPRSWLWAAGVATTLFVMGFMGLLKVWRVSPPGLMPVVRVSLLDMLQAKMLARSAREHVAAKEWQKAAMSWRGAVANNPGDVGVIRDWLAEVVSGADAMVRERCYSEGHAYWLLRLRGTNDADLNLVLRFFGRVGMREAVAQFGQPRFPALDPGAAGEVLKAVFQSGNMEGFDQLWKLRGHEMGSQPEVMLHREAWKAHWGPPGTLREGQERLLAATNDKQLRKTALKLSRAIAYARMDEEEHGRILATLDFEGEAGVEGHVEHWLLLAGQGRSEEAKRLAASMGASPRRLQEAHLLGEVLLKLGMAGSALAAMERMSAAFVADIQLVMLRARCLTALQRWDELRMLGLSIRRDPRVFAELAGASYALEAVANKHLDRASSALELAAKAAETVGRNPVHAAMVAFLLAGEGFAEAALRTLKQVEATQGGVLGYWMQRLQVATMVADAEELVSASRKARDLAPGNPVVANNYAAALIVARQSPAEAIRLTFQNLAAVPGNPDFQLNHAMALTANSRHDEAASVLQGMRVRALTPEQVANYHLAWFDVMKGKGDWKGARERYGVVDKLQLKPLQLERLEREHKAMPRS